MLLAAVLAVLLAVPAGAHFSAGSKPRTVVVTDGPEGLEVLLRVPAPLLFSDVVTDAMERQVPFAHPFVRAERVPGGIRHRLLTDAIAADEAAWTRRLAAAHRWRLNGRPVEAEVTGWRIAPRDPGEGFGTAEAAHASLAEDSTRLDPVFGDAVVEVALSLDAPVRAADLQVRSALPPLPLPPGVSIDNHLRDERREPVSLTVEGQLQDWQTLPGSPLAAALAFGWQGVVHILEGLDHVLLVVCLALGAGASRRLIVLVTAFTLGHALTLVASALGYVPQPAWFIPAVEAAIAATVVYAAVAAWRQRIEAVWIMGAVGLLHGLGFSFVLSEILGRDAPAIVSALAAFTVGVEVGQIVILAATLAVMSAVALVSRRAQGLARVAVLGGVAAVAGYWTVERALTLIA